MENLEPKELEFQAEEYFTYGNFSRLADHIDGSATAYTINYTLLAPEDYEGFCRQTQMVASIGGNFDNDKSTIKNNTLPFDLPYPEFMPLVVLCFIF